MAFDYLCFFSNEANTRHDLQVGRFGVNPYRTSHFDADFWSDDLGWDRGMAEQYVETLERIDGYDNRVFDLRVPGVGQFMTSLAAGVAEAVAGQATPQEALDGVAEEWSRTVERVGKDRVREAYANVVEIEDAR